ncbi:MAG: hypothetical protein ACFNJO_03580 [Porphyromonas endodontalis]
MPASPCLESSPRDRSSLTDSPSEKMETGSFTEVEHRYSVHENSASQVA